MATNNTRKPGRIAVFVHDDKNPVENAKIT